MHDCITYSNKCISHIFWTLICETSNNSSQSYYIFAHFEPFYSIVSRFSFRIKFRSLHVILSSCQYNKCLQCFDDVGWAAGRASGL